MKIHGQIKTRLRFISAYLGQTSFGSDSKSSPSKKRHDNLYIPNYKYQVLRYFRTCPLIGERDSVTWLSLFFVLKTCYLGPLWKGKVQNSHAFAPPTDYVFILTSLGSILTIFKNQWFYEPLKVKRGTCIWPNFVTKNFNYFWDRFVSSTIQHKNKELSYKRNFYVWMCVALYLNCPHLSGRN